MDLIESLRAIYFAPVPLIVLNQNRTIKMINRPAEVLFGIGTGRCIGQRLERFLDSTSQTAYVASLNEASKTAAISPHNLARPVATRLQLQQSIGQSLNVWAEFTISAWFLTDALPSSAINPPSAASSESGKHSIGSGESMSSLRSAHEAHFTISVVPSSKAEVRRSPSSDRKAELEYALKESAFENLDTAVLILSKDGKTEIRNRACEELFASFQMNEVDQMPTDEEPKEEILPWAQTALVFYDDKFEKPLIESEWPIYECSRLGQTSAARAMGLEIKSTGERLILKVEPKVIRDKSGYGEHIGGFTAITNVTAEHKRLKQESEMQSVLQLRQTVDTMPHLIWQSSPIGYCHWYSASFHQFTAASQSQLEGSGWTEYMHPEDLAIVGKIWTESLRTGQSLDCAFRLKRHDGVFRWFLCRASPLRDTESGEIVKWIGTNTDVHDQVEALTSSQQAQTQLQSIINHAAVTIWAVDLDGIITVAEGPGVRMIKVIMDKMQNKESNQDNITGEKNYESVIGRSIYDIPLLKDGKEIVKRALQGETVVREIEFNGRWFRSSYLPLRRQEKDVLPLYTGSFDPHAEVDTDQGEIVGMVGVSIDITERREAEIRMEESTLEKTRALAAEGAAREASRLKSQFLANMSHEIRTPIAGIVGLCELLLDESGLTPQHREYAETIERSAEGLLTVINDVLDFSKVEIGKLDVEQIPFNLVVLLGDLRRMLSFATQKKGLEFKESVNLTYKGHLVGDLGRLRQVITNLLTNAIKFTSQGYVSLEVAEQSEDANAISIRFDIKDTGCGIHSDALSQLFQPFSQADASTARRFGGTGLGLSISKNLVQLMGGEIGLNSVEGKGSHAWFVIPFRRATVMEERNQMLAANTPLPETSYGLLSGGIPITVTTSLSRPRKDIWILVAEDNVVNARIASRNVEKMGFSCYIAINGLIALEELHRRRYDAVLMDCQMPDCDGYEATRQIRKSPNVEIRTLPVIALTASAIKGDRERALEAGMIDYLAKPVKRPALESTLLKWLYDYNTRQSLAQFLDVT